MSAEFALAISVLALALASVSVLVSLGSAVRVRSHPSRIAPTALLDGSDLPLGALGLTPLESVAVFIDGPSLIFFANRTCSPCRMLVDNLNMKPTLMRGHRALFIETEGETASLREVSNIEATWAVDIGGKLQDAFQVRATPTTFLVHNGKVVTHAVGPDISNLIERYDKLVEQPRRDPTSAESTERLRPSIRENALW